MYSQISAGNTDGGHQATPAMDPRVDSTGRKDVRDARHTTVCERGYVTRGYSVVDQSKARICGTSSRVYSHTISRSPDGLVYDTLHIRQIPLQREQRHTGRHAPGRPIH